MVALVIFGLIALLKLKTDEFPDVAPPCRHRRHTYPGASPEGVEKEILEPVEEQIGSISRREDASWARRTTATRC